MGILLDAMCRMRKRNYLQKDQFNNNYKKINNSNKSRFCVGEQFVLKSG
jgi:hypothetical protein